MRLYTFQANRDEIEVIIDALETWPGNKPSQVTTAVNMVDYLQSVLAETP